VLLLTFTSTVRRGFTKIPHHDLAGLVRPFEFLTFIQRRNTINKN